MRTPNHLILRTCFSYKKGEVYCTFSSLEKPNRLTFVQVPSLSKPKIGMTYAQLKDFTVRKLKRKGKMRIIPKEAMNHADGRINVKEWLASFNDWHNPSFDNWIPSAPPPPKQSGTIMVRLVHGGRSKPLLNNLPEPDVD